ncbi:DUF4625 domain-containing protein [Chitinophaga horti]|uniref:DUF4625 domain-containing protein n=1 Tax=Chitinophaga horti TaxID=2920382 RepID=A0ABY6IV01_9BACT|nr:DUF4625 domain-containing protein [Chitinophaga horti]UYQ91193.1 DUF4625 domain-containing protein [Chitinophaga horti]
MRLLTGLLCIAALWTGCKKDDAAPAQPVATNVEIGTGNEAKGYIGQDFHFNADVKAATKIDTVAVEIRQRNGNWHMRIAWGEFKGLKNTNVHKHFYIPTDAPAGSADFLFTVTDQDGSKLSTQTAFTILEK